MTDTDISDIVPQAQAQLIAKDVLARITAAVGGVKALVNVSSSTSVTARFASNEVLNVGGQENFGIGLSVEVDGRRAAVSTNRWDAEGLAALVAEAEGLARQNSGGESAALMTAKAFEDPPLYFEASLEARGAHSQGKIIRRVAEIIERAQLVGTGTLSVGTQSMTVMNTAGVNGHTRKTYGEFRVNVRTANGKGSGWAWGGTEDFAKVDPIAITARAIDIARRSDNPVAIEPGRYVVILEPEALAQLIEAPVLGVDTSYMSAQAADDGSTVFSLFEGKKAVGNKLGWQMTDRRMQLFYDPFDEDVPFSPLAKDGGVFSRTYWIENGVLKNLAYGAAYGRRHRLRHEEVANPQVGKLEITGPTQTLEEMIASTKRGIWVHRFSGVAAMSPLTLLLTGVTRDGTFLIENGKVTKAIKNLRFSESPFFILNKIEAFGSPVRASAGLACPRLKVRDFEFTSLSDAI